MCVSPRFGRYAEIRANAGDPDRDCGKIVTIGGISGFGRNPTLESEKLVAARRRSQNLHVSTFANLRCGLSWSVPSKQLGISCEPSAAALSWMNFYFAAFDLLTQLSLKEVQQCINFTLILYSSTYIGWEMCPALNPWQIVMKWRYLLRSCFPEIYRFTWNRCFQGSACGCIAGNYDPKLSDFTCLAHFLLPSALFVA